MKTQTNPKEEENDPNAGRENFIRMKDKVDNSFYERRAINRERDHEIGAAIGRIKSRNGRTRVSEIGYMNFEFDGRPEPHAFSAEKIYNLKIEGNKKD